MQPRPRPRLGVTALHAALAGTARFVLAAAIVASALAASTLPAQPAADEPDFRFTRLMYQDSRGRTMSRPPRYSCPDLGGRDFFPPQGSGWGTDYPGADCKFMWGVDRLTALRVHPDPNVRAILDMDLSEFPYVYVVEPGGMRLSDLEAAALRDFLLRGGFLHVDDFWGLNEKRNLETELGRVFPDRPMEVLPSSHPVFRMVFNIDTVMQIPNRSNGCYGGATWESSDDTEPRIYGISDDDDRLMVLVTYNSDLGDAWEYLDLPCYPAYYATQALQMGVNFMIYAMTH